MNKKIKNVLIANRGVPAIRIMHTCRDRKIATTAVYSTPDRLSEHVFMADTAVHIGEAPPIESYLNMEKIIKAAVQSNSDAIHPGWGFLAENHFFAQMVIDAGLVWIGPRPEILKLIGDKIEAKKIAEKANLPTIPGINNVTNIEQIKEWIRQDNVSFPVILKASAGGGGKGMLKVENEEGLALAFAQAKSEAKKSFGDDTILVEKYIERCKHIEVQTVADDDGNVVHLFERECTIQRRNQKIIEEAPSPTLDVNLRHEICSQAVRLMKEIGYSNAGTVEFIFDSVTRKFYFLEINARLQVEHGVTELITGLDIVGIMFDIAMGKRLPFSQSDINPNRWAIEVRLNAEDPRNFSPSFGKLTRLQVPIGPNVRVASGVYEGADIPPYYDSLFMLLMTAGADRKAAIGVMERALGRKNLRVEGVKTLAPLLLSIIRHPVFIKGEFCASFIEEHMDELVSTFAVKNVEDELIKIASYVAEVSALGAKKWM